MPRPKKTPFEEDFQKQYSHRAKTVRDHFNLTQKEAAALAGTTKNTWAMLEQGFSKLRLECAKTIAEKLDISYPWLALGYGEMQDKGRIDAALTPILLVEGAALAGLGDQAPTIEDNGIQQIFYAPLNVKGPRYAIQVSGNSMFPVINDKSFLILDEMTDQNDFKDACEYVILSNGMTFVKKVNYLFTDENGGKFELSSHNETKTLQIYANEIQKWYKITHVLNEL